MKPIYPIMLLSLCLGAAITTTAQRTSALQAYTEGRWIAKVNLLSWIDFETPTFQPGVEYRFNNRLSGEFTLGIPMKIYDNIRTTDSTYNRYYKLKAELKFFPGERRSFYLGPELSYISKKRTEYHGHLITDNGEHFDYDFARIEKSIIALPFKIGFISPFRKNNRWIFDAFFGLGPRFSNVDIEAVNLQPTSHGGWMFWNNDREGFRTGIHLTMGLKLGYIIH